MDEGINFFLNKGALDSSLIIVSH
jgi:hypothetical protein